MGATPKQLLWRDRVEALIGLAAPGLDLLLGAGERVSGLLAGEDRDYYPIRHPGEAFELDTARRGGSEPVD
jgi:hypothetical protein